MRVCVCVYLHALEAKGCQHKFIQKVIMWQNERVYSLLDQKLEL
jgi:hypothetical protein